VSALDSLITAQPVSHFQKQAKLLARWSLMGISCPILMCPMPIYS